MIALGCDHGGYELKKELMAFLDENNYEYKDFGCDGEAVDYPDIAKKVCAEIVEKRADKGILICGTGIGISMAANKIKGIRAALCADYFSAKYTRLHNDSNVICFGGRTMGAGTAKESLSVFLTTEFEGGRHAVRVDKMMKLENE